MISIREADEQDAKDIVLLSSATRIAAYPDLLHPSKRAAFIKSETLSPEQIRVKTSSLQRLIRGSKSTRLIATEDGIVIGYCSFRVNSTHTYVSKLYVHPDMQGRGIGKGLLLAVTQYSVDTPMQLHVFKSNTPSVNFYKKLGFTEINAMSTPVLGLERLLLDKR